MSFTPLAQTLDVICMWLRKSAPKLAWKCPGAGTRCSNVLQQEDNSESFMLQRPQPAAFRQTECVVSTLVCEWLQTRRIRWAMFPWHFCHLSSEVLPCRLALSYSVSNIRMETGKSILSKKSRLSPWQRATKAGTWSSGGPSIMLLAAAWMVGEWADEFRDVDKFQGLVSTERSRRDSHPTFHFQSLTRLFLCLLSGE